VSNNRWDWYDFGKGEEGVVFPAGHHIVCVSAASTRNHPLSDAMGPQYETQKQLPIAPPDCVGLAFLGHALFASEDFLSIMLL